MAKPKWRIWLAGGGVAAALGLAVFVGAAAATTGAPVFYDARYPAPASSGTGEYDVDPGSGDDTARDGAPVDEARSGDDRRPATRGAVPPADARPAPPSDGSAPPSSAPGTPTPAPSPAPTPAPSPDDETSEPRAPGGPPADGSEPADPPTAEEREAWLAFQQIVRECMADAGQEYLYWEWWNAAPDASNRFPAMPADLTPEQYAAWELALHGERGTGDAYRWEEGGCWGVAVHATGGAS